METCPTTSFGIVHTKRTTAADKCFSSERAEVKISSLQRDKNKETYMPEFPFFPHLLSGARSSDWEMFPLVNQLWSPTDGYRSLFSYTDSRFNLTANLYWTDCDMDADFVTDWRVVGSRWGIISILQYLSGGSLGWFYTCVNYAFYFLDKQSFTIRVDVFRCRCVLQCNLFTVSHPPPPHTHKCSH